MQLYALCTLLFLLHTLQGSENFQEDSNIITAAVAFGHRHFDISTFHGLKLLNNKFNTFIYSKENNFYSIRINDKEYASVKLICSQCLLETCTHKKPKYRGLFCRIKVNNNPTGAYLIASEIYELIESVRNIQQFQPILNTKPIANIPDIKLPQQSYVDNYKHKGNNFSYNETSRPYYLSETNQIGILEGAPNLSRKKEYLHIIPVISTIHECLISADGVCIRQPVFFKLYNDQYPFGVLFLFPALYKDYITHIENQSCNVSRENQKTIFSYNFYNKYYVEKKIQLDMLRIMCATIEGHYRRNCPSNSDPLGSFYESYKNAEKENSYVPVDDMRDWVKFALCAKIYGNKAIAINFLKLYDVYAKKSLYETKRSYDPIAIQPFGGILGPCPHWGGFGGVVGETASDYNAVLEALTDFSTLEQTIENIRKQKELKVISDNVFVEIRKNKTEYHIYPWHYCNVFYDCHNSSDWRRGQKFILKNCTGILKEAHPSNSLWLTVENIGSMIAIEEREENGKKIEIKHFLYADQREPEKKQDTTITTSPANNQIAIQQSLNHRFLFGISNAQKAASWLWTFCANLKWWPW